MNAPFANEIDVVARLRAVVGQLAGSDQNSARSLLAGAARFGSLTPKQEMFARCLVDRGSGRVPPAAVRAVGSLAGIMALFDTAKQHLKFPAIELGVPAIVADRLFAVRVNVAGERAREPGSLTVVTAEKNAEGSRTYLGRITRAGVWEASSRNGYPALVVAAIGDRLAAFAAEPAKIAGEHGRLTGRCCFCRIRLTDERSTAVGYGEKCSENYGLPWGARPDQFGGAA